MSLQLQQGKAIDAEAIRAALLNTAIPCNPDDVEEPERCLRGKVNLPGAMNLLFGQPSITISFTGDSVTRVESAEHPIEAINSSLQPAYSGAGREKNTSVILEPVESNTVLQNTLQNTLVADYNTGAISNSEALITPCATVESQNSSVTPSTAHSGLVYALGTLGYEFGSEARRDSTFFLGNGTSVHYFLGDD